MHVTISSRARADLLDIAEYISRRSPGRAMSFVDEIEALCLSLSDQPERFPAVFRRRARNVRRAVYGRYSIFYTVNDRIVTVSRILHSARDVDSLLGSGET